MSGDNDIIFSADFEKSGFDSSIDEAIRKAGNFENALDGLQRTLDAVDSSIDVEISTTVEDNPEIKNLLDLEAYSPDVAVSTSVTDDPKVDALKSLDDDTLTPEVDTQHTREGEEVVNAIDRLANLQVIDIAMQVSGNIMDVFNKIEAFTVTPFLDAEDAAAKMAGQLGETSDKAKEYQQAILNIQYDDLGDGAGQIGEVMTAAGQMLKDSEMESAIEDATRSALGFTKVFYEQDPIEVLNAMNTMVSTGLVKNFQEAGDVLLTGFQNGANRGGDLLDTIRENSITFKQMGLDGEASMSLIATGMDEGIAQSAFVADSLKTLQENLLTAADDPWGEQGRLLKKLGIDNPAEEGEVYGTEFIQSVVDAIAAQPLADQASIASMLFGEQGSVATKGILSLSTTGLGDTAGAVEDAGKVVDDTLRATIDKFKLELQSMASEFLSSEQIDLPGKLEAIKTGLQDTLAALQSGEGIGEAIEVGFKVDGITESLDKFQSIVGNLAIGFLELIASIQDIMGKDSSGTRATIANMAEGQLSYDLKIANADEVGGIVQTAISRGVQPDNLLAGAKTAMSELVNAGEGDKATELMNALQGANGTTLSAFGVLNRQFLGKNSDVTVPVAPDMSEEDYQQFLQETKEKLEWQAGYYIRFDAKPRPFDPADLAGLQDQLDAETAAYVNSQNGSTGNEDDFLPIGRGAKDAGGSASEGLTAVAEAGGLATDSLTKTKDNMVTLTEEAINLNGALGDGVITTGETTDALTLASMSSSDFALALQAAAIQALELDTQVDSLVSKASDMGALATALQSANLAAAGFASGGSGGGVTNSSTVNLNQNITVNSGAETGSSAAQTANALKGFG